MKWPRLLKSPRTMSASSPCPAPPHSLLLAQERSRSYHLFFFNYIHVRLFLFVSRYISSPSILIVSLQDAAIPLKLVKTVWRYETSYSEKSYSVVSTSFALLQYLLTDEYLLSRDRRFTDKHCTTLTGISNEKINASRLRDVTCKYVQAVVLEYDTATLEFHPTAKESFKMHKCIE